MAEIPLEIFVFATRSGATFVANVMRASRTTGTFPNGISDYFTERNNHKPQVLEQMF